jgi:hypothetical protein
MAKPGLSLQRHLDIGRRLRELQQELTHLTVEVGNAYPLAAKFPQAIRRTSEALSRARSEGDNQLSDEHPQQWSASVSYPGSGQRS